YIAESVKKGAELVPLKLSPQRITELLNSGDLKSLGNGRYSAEYPLGTQHFSIGKDGAVSTLNGEPIRVLTNPPEVGADSHHPLPITADYDLFSISPKASQDYNLTPFKVGSRFAYGTWADKNLPLFTSAPKKGGAADPNMGNVSHYTRAIVQSLNKEAASEGYAGGALVWHGDEANNPFSPGFDPADQPIFFVPGKKPVRVNSKQELLKFQEMLKQEGYSPGTSNRF
ncbi:MAG: toxin protein, partial [Pseudomonas sp.]|uniref:toxin protein n=1 Tax=Pseudomonas sp. TaxID=306 RepID=UPI0030EFF072